MHRSLPTALSWQAVLLFGIARVALGAEPQTNVSTLEGHTSSVMALAFAPDGKLLASSSRDKSIRLWDARTGMSLRTLTGHTGRVESLAFSPDGRTLATGGGGGDTTIRLWDLSRN